MKYFTSDTHFNHKSIIEACYRPFKNVWAMNAHMIKRWNEVVRDGDLVYHLGDFALPNKGDGQEIQEILDGLNGQIYLIRGNHDRKNMGLFGGKFIKIVDLAYIKLQTGQKVMLCHYPMLSWRASHHGSWHLHGHAHGRMATRRGALDVGVDGNNFHLIGEDEIPHLIWE
jgi:calcineurin-like phosphoesterase family protein